MLTISSFSKKIEWELRNLHWLRFSIFVPANAVLHVSEKKNDSPPKLTFIRLVVDDKLRMNFRDNSFELNNISRASNMHSITISCCFDIDAPDWCYSLIQSLALHVRRILLLHRDLKTHLITRLISLSKIDVSHVHAIIMPTPPRLAYRLGLVWKLFYLGHL